MPSLPNPNNLPHNRKDLQPGQQDPAYRAEMADLISKVLDSIPRGHDIKSVSVDVRTDGRGLIDVHVYTTCRFPHHTGSMLLDVEQECAWIGMLGEDGVVRAHPTVL